MKMTNIQGSNSIKLFFSKKILLPIITVTYSFATFFANGSLLGINTKWFSVILFITFLNLLTRKKHKSLINQRLTTLFFIFTIFETINMVTGVSSHPGGIMTLFSISIMSFTFYRLPIPILKLILKYLYYSIIPIICLSAIKGIFGIEIVSISSEKAQEFIETNSLQEKVTRFKGIFDNPNSLAIYSIFLTNWVIGSIFSGLKKNQSLFLLKIIFLSVCGAASIYCGVSTLSLQYPVSIFLVQISLRFFYGFKKLSFKQLIVDMFLGGSIIACTFYLQNLLLTTPDERKGARWQNFLDAFSQTNNWDLLGNGFAQNIITSVTIDVGPLKWFLELGMYSILLLIIYIFLNLVKLYKLRAYYGTSNLIIYYSSYMTVLANWTAENVIYSPLYLTTTIWIILSIIIEKMKYTKLNS